MMTVLPLALQIAHFVLAVVLGFIPEVEVRWSIVENVDVSGHVNADQSRC